jgi:hypothetical protein
MNNKLYISLISAAVLASATPTMAQDLKKDVIIEREVEPAVRAATRLSTVSPSILSPKVEKRKLLLSEYTGTGKLNCQLAMLEPAAYADTFAVSPYRGYAALGYFPAFNLGASLGYRFVNTEHTKLGAWLQYDGNSYKSERQVSADLGIINGVNSVDGVQKWTLKRHTFTLGAEFEHDFRIGLLGIDFDYTHDYTTQPNLDNGFTQNTNKVDFGINWQAKSHSLPWHVGLTANYFGFGKSLPTDCVIGNWSASTPDPVHEFIFGINGSIDKEFDEQSIGLDVDARFQNLNALRYPVPTVQNALAIPNLVDFGSATLGITSLKPHYTYNNGNFSADLGVKVDLSTGGERTGVYFSPDVKLAYAATSQFAIYAKVDGGKELNSLAELYDDSQFMSSAYSYERSEVPFDAKVGINVGPVSGFTAELWLGYSQAKNWLMPASFEYANRALEFFLPTTVKGFRYGARIGWQYNDVFKIHAQAEGAPTGEEKGYYKWRDNARWVINAGFTVSPIKPLDINVDWNLRTSRHLFAATTKAQTIGAADIAYWSIEEESLGKANSLDISARYRITDAFSAFVNVENLLSYHWNLTSELQNQGIHGLFGVTYKF